MAGPPSAVGGEQDQHPHSPWSSHSLGGRAWGWTPTQSPGTTESTMSGFLGKQGYMVGDMG